MAMVLNKQKYTFVLHMATFTIMDLNIYLFWHTQIALLKVKKVIFFSQYADYTNTFLSNSIIEFSKQTNINNHLIDLINNKQLSYSLIYSLKPVKLKTLKTYIKVNLPHNFIELSKLFADILILFICKNNCSF